MENFEALIFSCTILLWVWMLTIGVNIICVRLRAILHDRGYIWSWQDFATGIVVVALLLVHGVIL